MPLVVHKFKIPIEDRFGLMLTEGAMLLHVDVQDGRPYLWALVDPDATPTKRCFRLAGTGHEMVGRMEYVGTVLLHGGKLVFHLFERDAVED